MKKSRLLGTVCSCAISLAAMSSNASVVYTYTGNSFTNIQDNDPSAGTFTTSDFVSISFIVPELLTDLRLPILISPTSFTASNGRITLTNTSPLTLETIRVATDSSGLITGWHISLAKGDSDLQVGEQGDQIFTGFNTVYGEGDGGNRTECTERDGADEQCFNFLVDFGSNTNNPGTWSVSTNVVSGSLWDEGVIGDFNAGQLFTLTEGDNWFIGTQAWANDPIDGFCFTVPEGYQATIDVDYEYLNLGEAEGTAWIWDLFSLAVAESCTPVSFEYECYRPAGSEHITSEILQTPENYQSPSEWDFAPVNGYTLDAGTYQLADNFGFTDNQNSVLSYTFNFNVVAVPTPDGDLNSDGQVNVGDVLIALRIASGLMTASTDQMEHGDVAPLLDGSPAPDGVMNAADVLVIQRKALGQINY
jgi:hypothetical protein